METKMNFKTYPYPWFIINRERHFSGKSSFATERFELIEVFKKHFIKNMESQGLTWDTLFVKYDNKRVSDYFPQREEIEEVRFIQGDGWHFVNSESVEGGTKLMGIDFYPLAFSPVKIREHYRWLVNYLLYEGNEHYQNFFDLVREVTNEISFIDENYTPQARGLTYF